MLKYTFSASQIEAALSVEEIDGTIHDGGLQNRIHSGSLHPREYVSVVILAGRLQVLRGSALWGRLGLVNIDWTPFANFAWPVLSQEFLSADDAARYAHPRIGQRRDRQYAGYVFQRENNRFVVTEPLEGDIAVLDRGALYPVDNKGRSVFPDDHVMRARYVSHVAVSQLDPVDIRSASPAGQDATPNPIDSNAHSFRAFGRRFPVINIEISQDSQPGKWTRQDLAMSLQMVSVEESRQIFADRIPLYVSASQNGLARFEPFSTDAAKDFEKRLGTEGNPGPLAQSLANGAITPGAFIREQASVGRLTVLLNSELWGGRGQITPDWHSPTVPWTWKRPVDVSFGAICASADDAVAYRYARDTRLHDSERAWFGFILKHKDHEEYVATELFPVDEQKNNAFQLQSMFAPKNSAPWYQFPEGFDRYGFFYSRQRVKQPLKRSFSWLAQYFIPPEDIAIATYLTNRRSVTDPIQGIPLYISTQDGALLSYTRSDTSRLFNRDEPDFTLDAINMKLARREMLPEQFVQIVASSGELDVLRTSLCWDSAGKVDATWKPRMNPERRWLGPVFQSPDDAAAYVRSLIPDPVMQTVGGLILKRSDGLYVITAPVEVSREDFDIAEIYPDQSETTGLFPVGCQVMARYRSRVEKGVSIVMSSVEKQIYLNMFSVDTLYSAFTSGSMTALDEYLLCPDGSLICYQSGFWSRIRADLVNVLTNYKGLPEDLDGKKIKQFLRDGDLSPGAWVNFLAKAGNLKVIVGSQLWGLPRLVTHWVAFSEDLLPPTDYTKALRAPVCSPVFIQADAAARYAHELQASRLNPTFGFILRSGDGSFIATLPVDVQRSSLAMDRVFEQGRLLSGFALDAIYIRAALALSGVRNGDLRHFFILPNDMHQARAQANTPQGYHPIYICCADGALLKLELHPFEPGTFYDRFGQEELRPNSFASAVEAAKDEREIAKGTFIFADYVRRMARAGKLEVIETSRYWSRHGSVGEDWRAHIPELSTADRWIASHAPELGPVFHHPDDAARHAQNRVYGEPVLDRGYEGGILAKFGSNRFVPLEPIVYSPHEEDPLDRIFRTTKESTTNWRRPAARYPDGYSLVSSHQFHLSGNTTLGPDIDEVHANFASPPLVYAHTHKLRDRGFAIHDYYYSTPDGALLKYAPAYTRAERDLLLTKPVYFEAGQWRNRLSPGEFISRLIELGELRVLLAGHYWQRTGRMGEIWRGRRQRPQSRGIIRHKDEL